MATKTLAKRKAGRKREIASEVHRANASLQMLARRIEARGRKIPAEVQDELSRQMRERDSCIGGGPNPIHERNFR